MGPLRQPPPQSVPRSDDSEEIRNWFARRDQFAPLGDRDLWPPPPTSPFSPVAIDAMAVSGDGKIAFLQVGKRAWLVDTQSLVTQLLGLCPDSTRAVILSDDGSRAVLVYGSTIYVWELGSPGSQPEKIWQAGPLSNTEFLSMSRDGRTVAAAASDQRADVRIFDLERKSLTYSFTADADEGMLLHPEGRHIICFGDDGFARVFGAKGPQEKFGRNAGGAFSRDGTYLLTNDLGDENNLNLYPIDASGEELKIGPAKKIAASFAIGRWGARIRFSPDGSMALVKGGGHHACLVEIAGPEQQLLEGEMTLSSAIVAGGNRAFLGPGYHNNRYSRHTVAVVEWSEGARQLGAITASERSDRHAVLVGTSPLGFFGSLEDEKPGAVGKSLVQYYERPEMMPSILGGGSLQMSSNDELKAKEVAERAAVWQPFVDHLTADIELHELMQLNKGIIHLTRAIASRALQIDSDVVRFGADQLSWSALTTASAEIRGMSQVEQGRIFDEMLDRLRALELKDAPKADHKKSGASSDDESLVVQSEQGFARAHRSKILVAISVPLVATIASLVYLLLG